MPFHSSAEVFAVAHKCGDVRVFDAVAVLTQRIQCKQIFWVVVPNALERTIFSLFGDRIHDRNCHLNVVVVVTLTACVFKRNADYRESVIETVSRYRMTNMRKLTTFRRVPDVRDCRLPLSQALRGPIEELRRICE